MPREDLFWAVIALWVLAGLARFFASMGWLDPRVSHVLAVVAALTTVFYIVLAAT